MMLNGKRILILESDYIVAHAIQRVLEKEDLIGVDVADARLHVRSGSDSTALPWLPCPLQACVR